MNLEKNCGLSLYGFFFWVDGSFWRGAWGEGLPLRSRAPSWCLTSLLRPDGSVRRTCPIHIPEVRERLDREFTLVVYSHAQVYLWLKRMDRYFPWLEKELARRNLPEDLKFVAVAESDLIVSACSPAGAVWTVAVHQKHGANYGLNQSSSIDERMDFEMATESAFRYLQNLQQIFSNWTLAIAAYNCGERRVQDEMRKQKADNYYALKLPLETERYSCGSSRSRRS